MKKWVCPSIVAFCLFFFTNCNPTIKIIEDSTTQKPLSLNGQPLTIVYESTDLSKDFMISFKNHLLRELQNKGIKAQLETAKDLLPNAYLLQIKVRNERSRRLAHFTGVFYQFRGATLDLELKNTEGVAVRKKQAVVNHLYDSESSITSRKTAQKVIAELNLTN